MKPLYIEPTDDSAEFIFDNEKQIFQLKGSSMPENAADSFDPVISWIYEYGENLENNIMTVEFMFEYFNTSSTRKIMEVLDALESIDNKDHKVIIKWYFDNDDERMKEEGEGYADLCDLQFEFINELPKS